MERIAFAALAVPFVASASSLAIGQSAQHTPQEQANKDGMF